MMRTAYLAWVLALSISALGIAALPHADLNEHAIYESWASASLLILAAPHLLGLGLGMLACAGIARLDWARVQGVNPWWWLATAILVTLLPLAWRGLSDDRLAYWGVDTLIVAMPFLAAWGAGVNGRLGGGDRPPLGWGGSSLWAGLMVGVCVLLSPLQPFYLLLFLPLLLALAAPRLRRVGGLGFAVLAGSLLLSFISAPYRLQRSMAMVLADPYGLGYQASHVMLILKQLTWFGGDTLVHLPRAATQLLPVSLAEQWGGLAFVGVFVLMGAWLVLVRPLKGSDDAVSEYRHVFSRFLWLSLLLAAVDNACVNMLLISPHGQGMPLFSGNWGLIVMAWLLMGANTQASSIAGNRWALFGGIALLAIAALALARQAPTSTEVPHIRAVAGSALENAMTAHQAEIGGLVVLDARSGAILALESRVAKGIRRYRGDFNAVYQHTFAPGHTLSPILAAALIERGLIEPDTVVDTRPLRLKGLRVQDDYPLKPGSTVRNVVAQSSRAGAARMALMLEPEDYLRTLSDLGFATSVGYAHEQPGKLESGVDQKSRTLLGIASAGWGVEVNLLQLAQAYLPLAGEGYPRKVFSNHGARPRATGELIFQAETTRKVRELLAGSVKEDGTAQLAAVRGVTVGGKTGSVTSPADLRGHERQTALFVGMAQLDAPRYVIAVMLERQSVTGSEFMYGGLAAAPIFASIVKALFPTSASMAQPVSSGS